MKTLIQMQLNIYLLQLLSDGETLENYKQVLEEYKTAYAIKKENITKLNEELKEMKKLKV